MFSFRPINKCTDGPNESVVDSLALSSEESGIMECSVTLESSRLELEPFTHGRASIGVSQTSAQSSLSSSLLDLLKPLKKNYTRESEEVRIIKLYKHALRLCSSGGAEDRLAAKPLLESIVGSPLLKSDNLPAQLSSMKFATCKLLGDVYIRTGHHQRGLELFIKAARMDENDMCLLLRLFRAASHSGAFHIADGALSHLLAQRPCHPIALPLALPFYLALSEFEYCLELAVRALHADPLDERAIFCIQYINKFQPSLMYFLEDILKHRPNLLSESITQKVLDQMNNEVKEVRTIYRKKLDSHADKRKVPSVGFPSPLSPLSWSTLLDSTVKMYDRLDMESILSNPTHYLFIPLFSARDPRASEDEYFLSPTTISSLMETLSLYPLDSPGYLRVHAHFLWINYLLCSLRNDYSEMRIYASLLEDHLSTHSIIVERNYSVYHGHLTAAYMRVLLEQLDVVSEFESLTELSTQGRHLEVVTKVCDTLRKQRFSERNASDEGPKTVSNYVRQTDRLSLLRCSLRNLICTMSNNPPDTDNQPSDVAEHWAVCYRACGFLLEGTCTLFLRNEPVSTRNSDPIQMEHPRDLLSSIAVDALQMLPICWHALCDDPAYVTCYTTPADLDTLVPSEVARLPLQIDVCDEPDNGIELSSPNEANASKTVLRVGDACYSVSVILNFLAMRLKYSLDPSESFSLSHSLVSLVFEHLVCIEQSVPATILPMELQVTMCDTAFDALPVVSKLNFKCGSYPTSPSLLWLHLVHELWSVSPRGSLPPCGCRERPDVLALLKQILLRTSNLLNTVGSSWVPTDPELSELRNLDSSGVQSDHETTSSLSDSDQQTSCDDETVACVDELQHRTVGFWPENSPSLAIILAHAIDCLLPTGLLRDTTVDGLSDDLDALEKWSKVIRESKSTLFPKASPLWLRLRPSCTDLLSFSPPWMRRVMILLNQSLPGSHCKQRSNLASPAWWIQGPATETLRKSSSLDWECMSILVHFCCPGSLPEYDSVKTLSISVDLLNLLVETTKLLPADEEALFLPTTDVEALLQSKPTDTLKLPRNIVGVSPLSQLIYYLIADHFMKNNSFE
ncbi:unnamed protein product [Dicrocoelium dendriticum]|nr:unnamed protein product [Dicrocoelium dendriticum]